ncbi:MAG: CARDB domain-containing protein, partial [Desulfobacteraceae bacterium]
MKGLRLILWILVAAVILLLVNAPFSGAAAKTLFKKKANTPSIAPAGGEKPDLELKPLKWSKTPRQGDTVGRTSILNIIVVNKGKAASRNCKIQIRCTSLSGGNSPSSINGVLALSALNPGKSISLSWPSMSAEKWPAGTFKISAQADSQNIVKESNETNNKKYLSFTVQPKIQLKPPKKVGKEQLQPPKKAGRQQLKPAIKPSIQRAGSQIKDNLALIDYDILSVKSDPTQPHTQEYVTVSVKIHNKTPAYAGTPFYFKCKPLDGN